jgi:hypothetical protein
MTINKEELYFSTDIETNGPIPGPYSMLSFACVAITENGDEIGTYSANLATLLGAGENPDTMEFWAKFPDAWAECRRDQQEPEKAMKDFVNWVVATCGDKYNPVCVAMPSGFDFMFLYWYMVYFAGLSPFSFSCVDMKTYAMAMRRLKYRKSSKSFWPKRWFSNLPHTHIALDDAREQGYTFINMLNENNNTKGK